MKIMAASSFQAHKSFSVFLALSVTLFLLQLNKVNSAKLLSFSFPKFVPNQKDLILQGDALVTPTGKLQLTKVEDGEPVSASIGRALYAAPVQIWDNTTGNVASFVTSFTFVIKPQNNASTADGIVFFLAPPDTQLQKPGGSLFGIFKDKSYNKANQVVAVEFDTYSNSFDPPNKHIGIDVNSVRSIKSTSWGLREGDVAIVDIRYEAPSKTLVVSLAYRSRKSSYILAAGVDLKEVLPPWVRVGFSAAASLKEGYAETHDVHSWSFASTLPEGYSDATENNMLLASYAE